MIYVPKFDSELKFIENILLKTAYFISQWIVAVQ